MKNSLKNSSRDGEKIKKFVHKKVGFIICMARVLLGAQTDDIRGKIGNNVFGKGRSVHTIRKKVKPFNPQSTSQTAVRALTRQFSVAWRSLSPANIVAWNEAALHTTKSNIFGAKYHTTGHKLFVAYNVEAFLNGATVQIDLPFNVTKAAAIAATALTIDSTGTPKAELTFDVDPDTNSAIVIFATAQSSAGISNFKGKYRRIASYALTDFTTGHKLNFTTEYVARMGTLEACSKVSVQAYYTNNDSVKQVIKLKAGPNIDAIIA